MKQATKQNTISEILAMNPDVAALFLGHGMFCISCPSAQGETLEEACAVHGIDADELIVLINKFLARTRKSNMIAIGCDHGGFELKQIIIKHLEEKNIPYKDFGCNSLESVDYPDYAFPVAEAVASGEAEKGILVCGTGIGMSIAANKVKGIRCALCGDTFSAHATREHNDSNVLALGGRVTGPSLALDIVDIWLSTEFTAGRHQKRIDKISEYEK